MCSFSLPRNLPTKDPEEAERHRLQYEAMIEAAKKKGTYRNQWLFFGVSSTWYLVLQTFVKKSVKKLVTPVTTKKRGGGLWSQTMAKILRYIVEFYAAFIILNKQQNKLMVITSNCVGEEDGGQRVLPRQTQVKCKTWL